MNCEMMPVFAVLGIVALTGLIFYLVEGEFPNGVRKCLRDNKLSAFRTKFTDAFNFHTEPVERRIVEANRHEALEYIKKLEKRVDELEFKVKRLDPMEKYEER